MKKILSILMGAALLSPSAASAQQTVGEGTYYLYNVGQKLWFAAGNAWGTHAILNDVGLDVTLAASGTGYTIDTHVANQTVKHYLNEAWADGLEMVWTFTETAEGSKVYIISSDGGNLALSSGNNLGLSSETSENAQWQLFTEEERIAALSKATKDNPLDATFLLKDAGFDRNNTYISKWSDSPSVDGYSSGDGSNFVAEKFNTTFDVSQTISGPVGVYKVTAQGFYRYGGYAAAADAKTAGTEQLNAKFYANTVDTVMCSIFDGANMVAGVGAGTTFGTVPDSRSQAAQYFDQSLYTMTLNDILAADGTLKIGFKLDDSSVENDWACFDNVRVLYYGESVDLDALKESLNKAITNAESLLENTNYSCVTGEERTQLSDQINAAKKAYDSATDQESLTSASSALSAASNTFTDAKASYQSLADAKALADETGTLPYVSSEKAEKLKDATALVPSKAADAASYATEVISALRSYVESNALAEGVDGAVDMTAGIVNPVAENGTDSWTTTLGEGSAGSIGILSGEPWTDASGNSVHSYFDGGNWGANSWDVSFTQKVFLPSGQYVASVRSRAAGDVNTFLLKAADETAGMKHIGASGGVFDKGWNMSYVKFDVAKDDSVVIGVQGATSLIHNWMSFSDFKIVKIAEYAETATYNWNDSTHLAVSSSSSTAGDITADTTFVEGNVSLTVSPNGSGTANRFWYLNEVGPQLRLYGGKMTLNAADGKAITGVTVNNTQWNEGNKINDAANADGKWTGNSTNVVFKIAGGTRINSIVVTLADADASTTTFVEANNSLTVLDSIGAYLALEKNEEARLNLNVKTNQVVFANSKYVVLQDDVNDRIVLYNTGLSVNANDIVKGSIAGKLSVYNGLPEIVKTDSTDVSTVISEAGTAINAAAEYSVGNVKKPANILKLVSLKAVNLVTNGKNRYAVSGSDSIQVYDLFGVKYTLPSDTALSSLDGIVYAYVSSSNDTTYRIAPVSTESWKITVYNAIEEGSVFIPDAESVSAAEAAGWLVSGGTRVDNKTLTVNPDTEADETTKNAPGLGVKKGNNAKSLVIFVTGATELKAFATSTSSSKTRYLIATAVSEDGDTVVAEAASESAKTAVATLALDPSKKYKVEFVGVDDTKASGGDMAVHAIKFSNVVTGVNTLRAAVNDGSAYNLAGQKVGNDYKGIVIVNGKKQIRK